jgi:phosphoribosylformylglycinamidine (FGAM) synthase PurS component
MNDNITPNESNQPEVDALLQAAAQPGTPAELANMSAMAQQFAAAVTAPAEVAAPVAAHGVSRFAGRVTKRAAVMAGVGLLVAGTAAAAAGGVLPKALTAPFHSSPSAASVAGASTVPGTSVPVVGGTTTTVAGGTTTTVTGSSVPTDDSNETEGTEVESDEATEHAGRLFGLCQAWTDGVAKDPTLKPFHHLVEAAAAANQTVEQFCAGVLANPPASTLPGDADHHHAVEQAARLFGLCQAYTDALVQNPDLKPFHHLVEAAAAKNQTVAQLCADVLANPPATTLPSGSVPGGSVPQWTPGQNGNGHHDGQGHGGQGHGGQGHGGEQPTTTVPTTAG